MKRLILPLAASALIVAACDPVTTDPADPAAETATFARANLSAVDQSPLYRDFSAINERLQEAGLAIQLGKYEYLTVGASGEAGRLVLATDRAKQLPYQWVPGDPRRTGTNNLYWAIDGTEGSTSSGLTQGETDQATIDAMQTWQDVRCSDIPLVQLPNTGDVGIVQALEGYGGALVIPADYVHAGFLPQQFFEDLAPGGGTGILGVTFTFFCAGLGAPPLDLDGDGFIDTCYAETYYNDYFDWEIDAPADPFGAIDVETVVVHEAGHGLSQGHFGDIFLDGSESFALGGRFFFRHLHFSPYAVMNAAIWETQQDLTGTDIAGHCSIWGSWPAD